jgi:mannosyl-oligosaccharide alpha-1,2-mannosidase
LTGPLSNLASNATAVGSLLNQAQHLADNLMFAFDTPSGIPNNNLYLNPSRQDTGTTDNGIAQIGTLVLEYTHLSDLTGNTTYAELSQKGESYYLNPHPQLGEPFPGLTGTNINLTTGLFEDGNGGWTGGTDSAYEYLIKMYVYDSSRFSEYKDRWVLAADSSITYLNSHPTTRPDITFVSYYENTTTIAYSQHRKLLYVTERTLLTKTVACFAGGNFILGGLTLNEQKYIDFGLALVDGCHATYNSTVTGLGPEAFRWVQTGNTTVQRAVPADQAAFYATSGFWLDSPGYILRPEVIESYYYAYRATGDQMYRDWAWDAFVAINATCRTGSGFSGINDVNVAGGGGFDDFQESFFFAEVMKYSYLIHAPVSLSKCMSQDRMVS